MNVYLTVAQAKNIVFQLVEIIPEGVSVTDQDGRIIASSKSRNLQKISRLARECIEQAVSAVPYNERCFEGNRTASPLFFKEICVGAIIMTGDVEKVKRLTSIARAVGESVIYQPYLNDASHVGDIVNFEFLQEWLNTTEEYSLSFIRRGMQFGIDVTQPYYAVVVDGVWNPLSAQKAVESVLTQSNYYVCSDSQSLVLILHKDRAGIIVEQLDRQFRDVKFATGNVDSNLHRSLISAKEALFAGRRLHPDRSQYNYKDYEFAYALAGIQNLAISPEMRELFERPQYADLLQTLEVYIKESGNLVEVADKLHVHRNTLKYRLDRIQELTGENPRNFRDLFHLYAVYIFYKLRA